MKKSRKIWLILAGILAWAVIISIAIIMRNLSSIIPKYEELYHSEEDLIRKENVANYNLKIGHVGEKDVNLSYRVSGIAAWWKFTADQETKITFPCKNELKKGNFKMVAVLPDDTLITIFEGSYDDTVHLTLPKGDTVIKIAAVNAVGKIALQLEDIGESKIKLLDYGGKGISIHY